MWLVAWYVGFCLLLRSSALYFLLEDGGEKCFIQELAGETLLVAHYKCSDTNEDKNSYDKERSMLVEIKDPQQKIVLSRIYRQEGRFSYKSHKPGEYSLCLHIKTLNLSKDKIRIDLDLQVGEHAFNYSSHNRRMPLTNLEERYQQLLEKATEITKETDYLRYREEMFRGTTETISRRVLLWMVAETLLLIIIAVWQMVNLRKFLESKKLV